MVKSSGLIPDLPRNAWVVLGGEAVCALGSGLTMPFLLVYLHSVRGIGLGVAGLALSTGPLLSFAGNPLSGWLSDRFGARNTMILGLAGCAAGDVLLTLVTRPWQAVVAVGTFGFAASLAWPAADALISTVVVAEKRSSVFAVRNTVTNAGLGTGALVAAAIVDLSSPGRFVLVFLCDAASFIAFVPLLLTVATARPDRASADGGRPGGYREVVRDRVFRRVWLLTALVVAAGFGQIMYSLPAYATRPGGVSVHVLGVAYAANTITIVAAQLVILRLLRGRRRTRAIVLACACWASVWALTLGAGQLGSGVAASAGFVLAMVVFGLAETLFTPMVPAIVNDLAPDALRGRYNGASILSYTAGLMSGPALAGLVLGAGQAPWLFGGLIAACGIAALLARRLERHLPLRANLISPELSEDVTEGGQLEPVVGVEAAAVSIS